MKKRLQTTTTFFLLLLFLSAVLPYKGLAQCAAPTAATNSATPAACQGQGRIISNISNPPTGAVYQYQLQYDSTGNTSVVKPWQSSDTFNQVGVGQYKVYIRRVCSTGFSSIFVSASVTVSTTTTPLSITQAIPLNKSSCGNGQLRATATGGNTAVPYQYALVPSLNQTEPVTNYVRPQQSSNTFTGLPAGSYYIRVYDGCNTYATANVVIDTVTESVQLASPRTGDAFYGCDSVKFAFTVTINNRLPTVPNGSLADPNDRFWVTYNGVTDTLTNNVFFGFYQASTGTSYTNQFDMLRNITYPMTVTYGFKSACGNVYQQTVVLAKPKLKISVQALNAVSCTQRLFSVGALDSVSGNTGNYFGIKLSNDGGLTWRPAPNNISSSFLDTLVIGNTYNIWLASGCDTAKTTVSVSAPIFNLILSQFTAYSCNNNSGFYIGFSSYSGNPDSIKLFVLNQPVAGTIPDSFVFYGHSYQLSYDIPPGTYTLAARDQCGRLDTTTITINPTVVAYTITPLLSCQASQSGFRLNLTETNYQTSAGGSYLRAIVTNTATNQVDSFQSAGASRPATIDVIGLSNGNYTIRVIKVRPVPTIPYFTCSINSTYTNTSNQALSLSQSTFTSACINGTATIVAQVQGGGGSNQFYLDLQSGSSWNQIAGPQSSNIFNNLLPNNVYQVRVTDVCGNGTQYSTSFSNAAPALAYSSATAPCPGQAFTMSVDSNAAAVYAWQKDSAPITGAVSASYTLNPVPLVAIDTYKVKISYGSCAFFSKSYVVNPALCGLPLPILLESFTGVLNENGQAALNWKITNFETVQSFDVEYGSDGIHFKKAGTVLSNNTPYYQYTDEQHPASTLFYRLRMASMDGESTYSNIINLKGKGTAGTVKVYPTVASDKLNLSYTATGTEEVNWSLTDMQGRMVRSGAFSISKGVSVLTINNLSDLANGTYILSVNNGTSFRHQEKIIIKK